LSGLNLSSQELLLPLRVCNDALPPITAPLQRPSRRAAEVFLEDFHQFCFGLEGIALVEDVLFEATWLC